MTWQQWMIAGLGILVLVLVASLWGTSRRAGRANLDADYWHDEYLEVLKGKVEAAANAKQATELVVDRQNRVVELNTVIVALRRELTDAYALAGLPAAVLREAVES